MSNEPKNNAEALRLEMQARLKSRSVRFARVVELGAPTPLLAVEILLLLDTITHLEPQLMGELMVKRFFQDRFRKERGLCDCPSETCFELPVEDGPYAGELCSEHAEYMAQVAVDCEGDAAEEEQGAEVVDLASASRLSPAASKRVEEILKFPAFTEKKPKPS